MKWNHCHVISCCYWWKYQRAWASWSWCLFIIITSLTTLFFLFVRINVSISPPLEIHILLIRWFRDYNNDRIVLHLIMVDVHEFCHHEIIIFPAKIFRSASALLKIHSFTYHYHTKEAKLLCIMHLYCIVTLCNSQSM